MRWSTTNAGVPLVQVPDGRRDAQRAQRAHAADAENDFLLQPRLAVAAVEPGGQLAILRRVLFETGVEEIQAAPGRRRIFQTLVSTARSPSGTATMHGVPSGFSACSMATSGQFSRSYVSCCHPSCETC